MRRQVTLVSVTVCLSLAIPLGGTLGWTADSKATAGGRSRAAAGSMVDVTPLRFAWLWPRRSSPVHRTNRVQRPAPSEARATSSELGPAPAPVPRETAPTEPVATPIAPVLEGPALKMASGEKMTDPALDEDVPKEAQPAGIAVAEQKSDDAPVPRIKAETLSEAEDGAEEPQSGSEADDGQPSGSEADDVQPGREDAEDEEAMPAAGPSAGEEQEDADQTPLPPDPEDEAATAPPLSEAMVKLRDHVRNTLEVHSRQPLNTRENTPAEILHFCLPYGCETAIGYGSRSGKRVNAIGSLCWNYACAGYSLLEQDGTRLVAKVGYGMQESPSQLLAVLALSKVSAEYELRVDGHRGTVADLVESEQLQCFRGSDMSFKLIGLSFYAGDDEWQSRAGERWTIERVVEAELERTVDPGDRDVADHLMGLSYALDRRTRDGGSIEGQLERARTFIHAFHDHALDLQNPDGSWHPRFFAARGASRDSAGLLRSTGHVLRWLVFSLPEDRLEDPRVVRSVQYLTSALGSRGSRWLKLPDTPRDLDGMMHALHALSLYDQRVFQPRDPAEPAEPAADTDEAGEVAGTTPDEQAT